MANSWEFLVGDDVDLLGLELRSHNLYVRTYVRTYVRRCILWLGLFFVRACRLWLAYSSYMRADCGLAYSSELETNTVNTFIT